MNEPAYERIASSCERIEIDFSKEEMAVFARMLETLADALPREQTPDF